MTVIYTELPLFYEAIYEYTVSLEEQQRILTFYFNERDMCWRMDIKNIDGTVVVLGVKLVPEYPILSNLRSSLMSGYFVLSTENEQQAERFLLDSDVVPQFYRLFHIYEQGD